MKLLLDEHFHRNIAPQLRDRGHDVASVTEEGLRGTPDDALLEAATARGRAIVTNNVGDFAALERRWAAEGRTHAGLIYTSDASLSRSAAGVGEVIRRLERELNRHAADDALVNTSIWLAG